MLLSRKVTKTILFFLDECIPPLIRDSNLLMWPLFKLVFKSKAYRFLEFKAKAHQYSGHDFLQIYKEVKASFIKRSTDLTKASIAEIEKNLVGDSILDIACGHGFLARKLVSKYTVTAADYNVPHDTKKKYPDVMWLVADVLSVPCKDAVFDTVICAHTLEHVLDIQLAIEELRRVARKRLIVVVPKQRHYKYTFDLHLHFFPYPHSLMAIMNKPTAKCEIVGGDLFYVEDIN